MEEGKPCVNDTLGDKVLRYSVQFRGGALTVGGFLGFASSFAQKINKYQEPLRGFMWAAAYTDARRGFTMWALLGASAAAVFAYKAAEDYYKSIVYPELAKRRAEVT